MTVIDVASLERPLVWNDLHSTPDDGQRYEIIGGELVVTPVPFTPPARVVTDVMVDAGIYAEKHQLGIVLTYLGVMLTIHDVVVPDLVFYTPEQWQAQQKDEYCEGSPAMIGEVMSDVTRRRDLVLKRAVYARSGIPEYWLLDPDVKTVAIEELVDGAYRPRPQGNGRVTSRVLDGFVLDAEEVFRQLRELEAMWRNREQGTSGEQAVTTL